MPIPTKVQWIGYPVENPAVSPTITHVRLPNPSVAGDTIIIVGQYGSGSDIISSITDDQGNSGWTKDKTQADVTNGQSAVILRCSNVAENTRVVTINFSGATSFTQFNGMCVNNLATSSPVDGTPVGQVTSGTSISCGAITTTLSNSFLVFFMCEDAGTAITTPTLFTSHANWVLFAPDNIGESTGQYGVVPNAGTLSPTITSVRSLNRVIALCAAYKTASSGGAAAPTAQVQFVQHMSLNNFKSNFSSNSFTINVPCVAGINALDMVQDDGNDIYTSISSVPSNTWNAPTKITNSLAIRHLYATPANVSPTMTVTVTTSATPTSNTNPFLVAIYGMSNCGAFDTIQSGSGNLASVPPVTQNNVLTTALITAEPNEVIILYVQQVQQSITGIVSTTGTALPYFIDCGQYESLVGCNDGGPAVVNAASPGIYNFNVSYSNYQGGVQVTNWAAQAIAFKSLPAVDGSVLWAQSMV